MGFFLQEVPPLSTRLEEERWKDDVDVIWNVELEGKGNLRWMDSIIFKHLKRYFAEREGAIRVCKWFEKRRSGIFY